MLAELVGLVTRQEGKKFLKLKQQFDELALGPGAGREGEISLYIHIPFCRTLCPFCCFNRYLFHEDRARKYFQHLRRELEQYIKRGFQFTNFYFGGGTPTILMDELTGFINHLRENFTVKQISLETTAADITPHNIDLLKTAGINRLSIGVQSFSDKLLRAMGRVSLNGEEIKEKLLMAQGQFNTLNADFIFNFPGQTPEQFEADVETFKALGIDQATFYPLMPSPHKKDAIERRFNRIDTATEQKFYEIILKKLFADGYKASTAWCFSRGEHMIDEYIIDFNDYIGIGSGSVSIVNGNFYVNSFSLDTYAELTISDTLPVVGWRRLSEREHLRYYLLTKLFGMELDTGKFYQRFNAASHRKLWNELTFLKLFGLVEGEEKIRVTRKGMYPVSVMMREFFAALNNLREDYIEKQI